MVLLILESIGTSELILIAVVALIVFGPRKLPQMVKTIGKTMGEFRSATNEFKSTWEREAALEDDPVRQRTPTPAVISANANNSISRSPDLTLAEGAVAAPQVKTLTAEEAAQIFQKKEITAEEPIEIKPAAAEPSAPDKRDWL